MALCYAQVLDDYSTRLLPTFIWLLTSYTLFFFMISAWESGRND